VNEPTCAIDGCGTQVLSRGWCRTHYDRWYRHGDPAATAPPRQAAAATCSVEGCEGSHPKIRSGMCGKHYQRHVRYGATDLPVRPTPACEGPECTRPAGSKGLCDSHYKQSNLGKPLTPLLVATKNLGRPATCTFPGCDRPHKARGLCKAHRDHVTKGQELRPVQEYGLDPICSVNDCGRESVARGLCPRHRQVRYDLTVKYNLTVAQHAALLEAQGGVCAICRGTNPNGYRLSVDHDHSCCPGNRSCGTCVRGLLCAGCNFVVGHASDDSERLRAAADYLDRRRLAADM
jgi:hypothetical protein